VLTGHGERSRVLEAVRSGVHEFLLKPPSRAALKAGLLSVLATRDRQQQSEPRQLAS
jgi:YesN/AraC family two-component response regulator